MAVAIPVVTRNVKSGIQKNPKTQSIPTGPSQTVGVAGDPGVAGGPGNVPLGAFGPSGIGSFGETLQDIGASERELQIDRQTALVAAEEKRQLGIAQNSSADNLAAATVEYEDLRRSALYNSKENIAKFQTSFTSVYQKFSSALDGTVLEDKFKSDLLGLEYKQSSLAAGEQYGAEITAGELRSQKAVDKYIAGAGAATLDPEDVEKDIEILVNEAAGNLPQPNKTALIRKSLRRLALRQLSQMTKAFGGTGADGRAEIKAYMERPYIQALIGPEFLDEVQKSQQAITKEKFDASAAARKQVADSKEVEDRQDRFTKFFSKILGEKTVITPELLEYGTSLFFALEKGELPPPIKATPGEVVKQPGVSKTPGTATFEGKPKIETKTFGDPKNPSLAIVSSDTDDVTIIDPLPLPVAEPINDLYTGRDPVTNNNILSKHANEENRRLAMLSIGIVEDAAGGRVTTSGETAFIRDVIEGAGRIEQEDFARKYTAIQAINMAVDQIPENQRPKTFNYYETGKRIWQGLDLRPVVKGTQHPITAEGGKAIVSEIRAGLEGLEAKINRLAEQGKISLSDASGWWSGLSSLIGSTFGNIFDSAVSPATQRARFQFGLLARDFIRLVTLSPRFAVKEQELLARIFTGPSAFLAPGQAQQNIIEFERFLNERGPEVVNELNFPAKNEAKNKLLRELKIMKSIQTRITQFDLGNTGRLSTDEIMNTPKSNFENLNDADFEEQTGEPRVKRPSTTAPAPALAPAPAEEQAEVSTGERDPLTLPSTPEIMDFVNRFLKANPAIDLEIMRNLINSKLFPETDLGDARRQAVKKELEKRKTKKKKGKNK